MYNITVLSLIISGAIIIFTMIIKHNLKNQLTQESVIEPPISKKNRLEKFEVRAQRNGA